MGFIFYKFLSDKEVEFLKKDGYEDDDIKENAHENNESLVDYCQQHLGYFIAYDNLFSTWLAKGSSFTVDNVRTALSAFNRLISETQKKVFSKIFNTLETGLSKLGDSTSSQTKSISELIQLIKDIPTDGKQDYDVLGFIYEYLISNFAANAGKKAGEFYTPHEVSQLMSEIVAHHLKDREKIEIYDPTSGSGSLLITIGKSVAKYTKSKDDIMYYAQELKENTYNLTRMNLVMRGIKPDNIFTRCGDTLEQDWPMYDDVTQEYNPLYLDAVVSNPPYSQRWDPKHKDTDPRYRYGIAPKGKADYAFLLHDLYHLKPDGIMTILDLKMLERNMGFSTLIQQAAVETVSAIEDLDILDDIEVLRDTLEVPSFARKLSKVKKASPIFKLGISKEAIVEFTKNTPELAGKFKYSEDGTQIRLGTKKSKIAFLKLMNDAFLHSELTKQWYDASAKDNITQGAG